jgi:hypothetical protein
VTILLGNGDGTFTIGSTFACYSYGGVVADFNGDGIPDLAVTNSGGDTLTILLGNGDGTFTPTEVSPATGPGPTAIAVGDFNGDGIPDLAVANEVSDAVTVLLGDGDGTFTATALIPRVGGVASEIGVGIAVADFNGDGILDLAAATSDGMTVLLGNGDGTFTAAPVSPASGSSPRSVAVGDFNGDGIPDLAIYNTPYGYVDGFVTILLGNGDGTFTATAEIPATSEVLAVGDFNGDGVPDVAGVSSESSGAALEVMLTERTQTATAPPTGISLPAGTGTHLVEASYPGDVNFQASISGVIG